MPWTTADSGLYENRPCLHLFGEPKFLPSKSRSITSGFARMRRQKSVAYRLLMDGSGSRSK